MRILHLHWVFGFALPWLPPPLGRRVAEFWFALVLEVARLVGIRVVWTAHNLLPHEPVFADDRRGRRRLVRRSAAVIAHSTAAAHELLDFDATVDVIPQGTRLPPPGVGGDRVAARERLDLPGGFSALYFGVLAPYKGVEDLIEAAGALQGKVTAVLVGGGDDGRYTADLRAQAAKVSNAVDRMRRVTDDELDAYLAAADVVVLPFRRVTNSSSANRAMASGVPLVVPDLAALGDIPMAACFRYEPGVAGLVARLAALAATSPAELEAVGVAGRAWVADQTWERTAERTAAVYRRVTACG